MVSGRSRRSTTTPPTRSRRPTSTRSCSESSQPGVHLPAADRDHRPPRPDRAAHARRPGEAGRDAPALAARRARGRVAASIDAAASARGRSGRSPVRISAEAIRDCVQGLAAADRGQLVMACGTGKTLVGPFLAERLEAKRVLVLVPSLSLLGQTLREWATRDRVRLPRRLLRRHGHEGRAGRGRRLDHRAGHPGHDRRRADRPLPAPASGRRRGRVRHLPVLAADRRRAGRPGARVRPRDRGRGAPLRGPRGRRRSRPSSTPAKIKARKRLFMTATPRYYTGRVRKEASEADWEVASMDDEEKFGPVLHRLTFAQAIDHDLLSDYQVVVVGVTDARVHARLAERGAFVTPTARRSPTPARSPARSGCSERWRSTTCTASSRFHSRIRPRQPLRRTRCPRRTRGCPLAAARTGTLWTDHVSGEMTAGERDVASAGSEAVGDGERGVLTNARCLTEGVDVPTLDGVAFIDPRRSQVDIVQAVGRAIRKAEDKTRRHHRHPRLRGRGRRPRSRRSTSSEFDRVWQVVKALRDHDDVLAEELDELRRELGRRGTHRGTTGQDRARPPGRRRCRLRPRLRHAGGRDNDRELGVLVRTA